MKIVSVERSDKKRSGDTYVFEEIATGDTYMAWDHKERFRNLRSGCSYAINGMFYNAPASEKYAATKVLDFSASVFTVPLTRVSGGRHEFLKLLSPI